jgi:hypothetical protein
LVDGLARETAEKRGGGENPPFPDEETVEEGN